MADLPELDEWTPGIHQIETSDPVLGGPEGISNQQGKQLASRTRWLKGKIDAFIDGSLSVAKAVKLANARTLSISGAGTGSASFDGSANTAIALTLADSGVVAGSYAKVTVSVKGLVTGGAALTGSDIPDIDWSKITSGKPSTLAGYGVALATQAQAEAGTDNALPMTPLRVFQAIARVVTQSTESLFGWAKIASKALTDAGSDDTTIVTPKKLRWGVDYVFANNGYIVFPSWLGGFVIQWIRTTTLGTQGAASNFPMAFPNACFGVWASSANGAAPTTIAVGNPTTTSFNAWGGILPSSFGAIAFGR